MAALMCSPPSLEPLQTVQRAENWGVMLALHTFSGTHVGTDNLNVHHGVARLLARADMGRPLSLVTDGDLLATIHSVLRNKCYDRVKVSKVKGHAKQFMAAKGTVRQDDPVGNGGARSRKAEAQ